MLGRTGKDRRPNGLLAAGIPKAVAVQVERVLEHLRGHPATGALEIEDIAAAFKTAGLTPPSLLKAVAALPVSGKFPACARLRAISFAAAVYPQRSSHMDPLAELPERLKAFFGIWDYPGDLAGKLVASRRLPGGMAKGDVLQLIEDLSGAQFPFPPSGERLTGAGIARERLLRRNGAALFLASCTCAQLDKACANWRRDAELLRCVRCGQPSAPSGGSKGSLAAQINLLHRTAWAVANKHSPHPSHHFKLQRVEESWEFCWDMLVCGFPYFSFLSRFGYWWRRYMDTWWKRQWKPRDNQVDPNVLNRQPMPAPPNPLQTNILDIFSDGLADPRCLLEGYRLVRATFFSRGNHSRSTEEIRSTVDDIWRCILYSAANSASTVDDIWRRIQHSAANSASSVENFSEIAKTHEVPQNTVYSLKKRLLERLQAYVMTLPQRIHLEQARLVADGELLEIEIPPFMRKRHHSSPAPPQIAAIARLTPIDETLLWPFTAYLLLQPRMDPAHADPWDFSRYVGELWYWVGEEKFEKMVRLARDHGSRANGLALDAFATKAVSMLLKALERMKETHIIHCAKSGGFRAPDAEEVFLQALRQCLAPADGTFESPPGSAAHGCKYLLAPLAYLLLAERVSVDEALRRLAPEKHEMKAAIALADFLKSLLAASAQSLPQGG